MTDKLKTIRDRIDAFDDRILELLNERARLAQEIGGAKRGAMGKMAQMFGLGGGMPSPEELAEMQKQMGGQMPNMPKLPDAPPAGAFAPKPQMPGLPGLGAKGPGLPGLGGFNPFGKKK